MVICLELGADLHMAQLMPLPLTVSFFTKIQIGFTFLVPAYPGSPGKRAIKRVCVCVVSMSSSTTACIRQWLPTRMFLKIVASREGISTSTYDIILWDYPSPLPKRNLDRFIRFCRAHGCDRQTDHGNVDDNRPHLATLQCAQNIVQKQWHNYNFRPPPSKHSLWANSLDT